MRDPDAYARWRAKIPFSDEEIAVMFERLAASTTFERARRFYLDRANATRRGHISAKDMRYVQYELVKVCSLCGKKALYRYGNFGRCFEHKAIRTEGFQFRLDAYERKESSIEEEVTRLAHLAKHATEPHRSSARRQLARLNPKHTLS